MPSLKLAEQQLIHKRIDISASAAVEGVGPLFIGEHARVAGASAQPEDIDSVAAHQHVVLVVANEGVVRGRTDHVLDAVQDIAE